MPFSGVKKVERINTGIGIAFTVFNTIAKKLNFTYSIIQPKENVIGDESRGILSMIYNQVNFVSEIIYHS